MTNWTGHKYWRLTVVSGPVRVARSSYRVQCVCECGTRGDFDAYRVKSGRTKSCGCYRREAAKLHGKKNTRHGLTKTKEWQAWASMKKRCLNPASDDYVNYGGRGISVHAAWLGEGGFEAFLGEIGMAPSRHHSLDRFPNNNGNYEPGNIRWATSKEQRRNFRGNRLLTFDGREQSMAQWAEEKGIKYTTLHQRLATGWSPQEAISGRRTR